MNALLTHEIGSLAKPGWRVKAYAGRPVPPEDVDDARRWGERLGVEGHEDLVSLLREAPLPRDRRAEVAR
jgi:5-methyltetrahydropteroyltriglutamate--homocysteine methyltransferase